VSKSRKSHSSRRIGLARTISKLGYCSRAQAFTLIGNGRIAVNGKSQRNPEFPIRPGDIITVDGQPLRASRKVYLMMNKPRGLVATASDEKGCATVYALLDPALPWVAPVGRLDKASEGLLLLTNDSEWAALITSPDSRIEKTYRVQVDTVAGPRVAHSPQRRCYHGELLRATRATLLRASEKTSWLDITLDEGRNRQIRRCRRRH